MRRTTVLAVTALLAIAGLAAVRAQSRPAPPSEDILPALLTEVRGLRAAMEQMASAGARVQLVLGRLQMQEQRVNNTIRRLDEVRTRLSAVQRQAAEQQDRAAGIEEAIKELTARGGKRPTGENGPPVEELQQVGQSIRNELTQTTSELQRLTGEESSLSLEIATEQARWTTINQQLEEIERMLATGVRR